MALNGCHVPTNVYTQKKKIQIQNEKKDTSDAKAKEEAPRHQVLTLNDGATQIGNIVRRVEKVDGKG